MLKSLEPFVSRADIAICHAEVPFAKKEGPFTGYPLFKAPQEAAQAVSKVGWDMCTAASNHTMDAGWDGLVRTIEVHEAAGIMVAGTWKTEEDSKKPVIYETEDGVKVGIVSQTYGLNGLPKAKGKDWSVQLLDADRAIEQAAAAKAAGADVVGIHIHAGNEYQHKPTAQQREYAAKVTASKHVDFVFGQHAHVVQPVEKVNGKWVIYGTGNLIAQSGPAKPYSFDGFMAEIQFLENADGSFTATGVEWAPTYITLHRRGTPARVYLIPKELENGNGPAKSMKDSAARTRKIVTSANPEGLTEMGS